MPTLSNEELIAVVGLIALVAVVVVALVVSRSSRKRRLQLRERFGPEYDREVERLGSVARAERELMAREKRVHKQHLHPLPETQRLQFASEWRNVQTQFVDEPSAAVENAHALIKQVMVARGYTIERFDQRVSDLSVEHAGVVQHYRAAHELAVANREGRANTEELRQALVHYRALFTDLLEQPQTVAEGELVTHRA
jgi:FtsZ-interacting cell division protein ZipA